MCYVDVADELREIKKKAKQKDQVVISERAKSDKALVRWMITVGGLVNLGVGFTLGTACCAYSIWVADFWGVVRLSQFLAPGVGLLLALGLMLCGGITLWNLSRGRQSS